MNKILKNQRESTQTLGIQAHQAFNMVDTKIQQRGTEDDQISSPVNTSFRSDVNDLHSKDLCRRVKRSQNCTTVCNSSRPVADNACLPSSSIDRICSAWPYLPPHVRDTILTLVDTIQSDQSRCSNAEQPSVQATAVPKKTISGFAADKLQRTILKSLRHTPEVFGFRMDPDGWVDTSEFVAAFSESMGLHPNASINRRFVQLTTDFEYASQIAMSHGQSPLVLPVATAHAIECDVKFYPTDTPVWQASTIPSICLQVWIDDGFDPYEPPF